MEPRISVCIPVYQGALTLATTLKSVLASANADFEVVIRDNGSTDGTGEVVAAFDDPRIRYLRTEETLPLPQNWQAAVEAARGELIKVVCADDLIHPDCLHSQAEVLKDPSLSLVACRRDFIDGSGAVLARKAGLPRLVGRHTAADVAQVAVRFGINPVGEPASVMFRRRDFQTIGGFNPVRIFPMDIDAWLRLMRLGDMVGQSQTYAAFRIWSDSISSRHNHEQFYEHLRFLTDVAADPRYEMPPRLRRRTRAAARLAWRLWALRRWYWARVPHLRRDGAHSWRD